MVVFAYFYEYLDCAQGEDLATIQSDADNANNAAALSLIIAGTKSSTECPDMCRATLIGVLPGTTAEARARTSRVSSRMLTPRPPTQQSKALHGSASNKFRAPETGLTTHSQNATMRRMFWLMVHLLCSGAQSQPIVVTSPPPSACACSSGNEYSAADPTFTCRAVGDPHYMNLYHSRFDFYGRGLFEHARFSVLPCNCEVIVQVFLMKLIRGWPANSAIGATAIRIGNMDVLITQGGIVSISRPGQPDATLQPTASSSSHVYGPCTIKRESHGRGWAWRVVLPAGAGSYLVGACNGPRTRAGRMRNPFQSDLTRVAFDSLPFRTSSRFHECNAKRLVVQRVADVEQGYRISFWRRC